jgi:superfamily II DNA or RNA helicase
MPLMPFCETEFPLHRLQIGLQLAKEVVEKPTEMDINRQGPNEVFAVFHFDPPIESQIQVSPEDQAIHLHCTCSHFAENSPCEHLAAVLASLDQRKLSDEFFPALRLKDSWIVDFRFDLHEHAPAQWTATHPLEAEQPLTSASWQQLIQSASAPVVSKAKEVPEFGKPKPRVPMRRRGPIKTPQRLSVYAIDLRSSLEKSRVQLRFYAQDYLPGGSLAEPKPVVLTPSQIYLYKEEEDRQMLWSLLGKSAGDGELQAATQKISLAPEFSDGILQSLSDMGKLRLLENQLTPYQFSQDRWHLALSLRKIEDSYFLQGSLQCGELRKRLTDVLGNVDSLLVFKDFCAPSDCIVHKRWYQLFAKRRDVDIPAHELNDFLKDYFKLQDAPPLNLPEDIALQELPQQTPEVRLRFHWVESSTLIRCNVDFLYSDLSASLNAPSKYIFDLQNLKKQPRDQAFEQETKVAFQTLMPKDPTLMRWRHLQADGLFEQKNFLVAAEEALRRNWQVVAYEKPLVRHKSQNLSIVSKREQGMDWFEVQGTFQFAGQSISLPQLIQSLRSGERLVKLGDGTLGILPEDWLKQLRPWIENGQKTEDGLRLSKVQALFLAASLEADNKDFATDENFSSLRSMLKDMENVIPADPDKHFSGQLRPYQREGLAWLQVLSQHELGGILADDMGLGKTIQVLALFCSATHEASKKSEPRRPHLVVAPKTLIFNWMQESAKFAPHLKVMDYTGPQRHAKAKDFSEQDVILTTYQTLRSDIQTLHNFGFDLFVLDEAQYIKNPDSQAAQACRLIKASRRIALSGTPVENSLTDLFSILSVVTPGLLTERQVQRWTKQSSVSDVQLLSRALRPFILRRSKQQVLSDLPDKTEQVLYCELGESERKRYDDLRQFYWSQLSGKMQAESTGRAQMDVLEALLRLRQAACHQGLLDEALADQSSSKFEMLMEQIQSVIADGHKALIFSQFTSLLNLLRRELQRANIPFEYLDGQTVHRQERVENFQNNPKIPLFLLSLKAGGVGLNLTAAEYVFILDPWWNPATEAQAIDRTHRIGQTKKVFAYKLIAKNTVEEKIIELQNRKRDLANLVIKDDSSVLKNLSFQELKELFQ